MTTTIPPQAGERWLDTDARSCYDVTPDGTYPVPKDYEGRLDIRMRVVEIIETDETHARVRNTHNGRESRIKLDSFHNRPGKLSQGFIRHDTENP